MLQSIRKRRYAGALLIAPVRDAIRERGVDAITAFALNVLPSVRKCVRYLYRLA